MQIRDVGIVISRAAFRRDLAAAILRGSWIDDEVAALTEGYRRIAIEADKDILGETGAKDQRRNRTTEEGLEFLVAAREKALTRLVETVVRSVDMGINNAGVAVSNAHTTVGEMNVSGGSTGINF
jgi:hypothetical protein